MSTRINPTALAAIPSTVDLIDVRTPAEFSGVHATGAVNLPLDRLTPEAFSALRTRGGQAYVICHSGARASQAIASLEAAGISDLVLVEGGTKAWQAAGAPVILGERRMLSLDRQMQLTVGVLILAGTALGAFINPWFLLIPAGVGAGLFNAGASGLCPLAMGIARMPWNRAAAPGGSCAVAARG